MKKLTDFVLAVLAGTSIAIGGTAFLSLDNKIAGALFFCVGLFMVCSFGLNLFTGKVCYFPGKPPAYLGWLALVWVGNLVGAELVALCVRCTRTGPSLAEKAAALCSIKTEDSLISLFLLGALCNVLIFVAVESYRACPHELGKYLGLFLGVAVFVFSGMEHCVANMFYFTAANAWGPRALGYILLMTAGNALGGVLFPLCRKLKEKAEP